MSSRGWNIPVEKRDTKLFDWAFVIIMLVLFACFAIAFVLDPSGAQRDIFFRATEDKLADFFNVAAMSVNLNPYWFGLDDPAPQEHGYPPLCYAIFYLFSFTADYANLPAAEAGFSTSGLMAIFAFLAVAAVVTFLLLRAGYRKGGLLGLLLPAAMMLSSVYLFSLERANLILLTAPCMYFFVLCYRSENKVVAELALIALALATAMKGYPALMGMLLLFDRRFAQAIRCAVYAVALVFLPFLLFTGGFGNISLWLQDISLNSQFYGQNVPAFGFGVMAYFADALTGGDAASMLKGTLDLACKAFCVVAILTCWFEKKQWQRVLLLGLAIVCLQTNSAEYLGLYLFIGIALFFSEKQHTRSDWLFLVLFVVFLNPLQFVAASGYNMTVALMGLSVDALLIVMTIHSVVQMGRAIAGRARGQKIMQAGPDNGADTTE